MRALKVQRVDYLNTHDAKALVFLLDAYAQDPMGGGEALSPETTTRLCSDLSRMTGAVSFIAWLEDQPIGLINCFEGYSTFKAKPLLNVHDIAVLVSHRGQGVGQALLQAAADHARERGCCKLTLEVLSGNALAMRSYKRFGFAQYELDPAAGQAQFMQKWL
jgi:ribosomal protein S18 acetylase RimI-like enzyme